MYKITEKVALNPTVTKMVIEAPLIAKKAKPGQFIIVRPFEDSERIPLTVAGYDREKGTVDIIFQIVGGTTMELNSLNAGDSVHDFVGPLGRATETEEKIEKRLHNARREVQYLPRYDYCIVNDDLEKAWIELRGIVRAERHNTKRFIPEL